jgi:hypothetical protein
MYQKPTYRHEALHNLLEEEDENPIEAKAEWRPDRAKIEQLLQEQEVEMRLPKIYYSSEDLEIQTILPYEATFEDDLIEKYEVFAFADESVQVRIYPKEMDPFWVTIDGRGVKGPEELLRLFMKVSLQPTGSIQKYAQMSIYALMGNDEEAIPYTNTSFRIVTDRHACNAA